MEDTANYSSTTTSDNLGSNIENSGYSGNTGPGYGENTGYPGNTGNAGYQEPYNNQNQYMPGNSTDQNMPNIPQSANEYQIDTSPFDFRNDGKEVVNHLSDGELGFVKDMAFALNLTNDQAQLQYDMLNNCIQNCIDQNTARVENFSINNGSVLANMWGEQNIDRCIADVETGINVAARMLGCDEAELKEELEYPMAELCLPNLINLFRNLAQIGGRGHGHGLSAGSTPIDAKNQLESFKNSERFKKAIAFGSGPEYKRTLAELDRLTKIANRENNDSTF